MADNTLQYKEYIATINFSPEDEVFFGKIIGINDLIVFEGTSVKELQKNFKRAIEDYLETCKELGKSPDKTYKGSFNIRISPELHRQAAFQASLLNISLNDLVGQAIQAYLFNNAETQIAAQNQDFSQGNERSFPFHTEAGANYEMAPIVCVGDTKTINIMASTT